MTSTQRLVATALLISALATRVSAAPRSSPEGETLETSGEEQTEISGASVPSKWELLSDLLVRDVTRLRDQQLADELPGENMTSFKDEKLPLPHLVEEKVCLPSNFSKERCLQRMASELQTFGACLVFVEREYSKSTDVKVADVQYRTKALTDYIMQKMKNPWVQKLDLDRVADGLRTTSAWGNKITVHLILREFRTFLTDVHRAVRYINKRKRQQPL